MATFKSFEELDIWKKAIDLVESIYMLSGTGELSKDWGMKDQIRRSAASISNNIAEGFEYGNNKDFIKFLRYAKGSTGEFRNQLIILYRVKLIDGTAYNQMYSTSVELGNSIGKLISYLKNRETASAKIAGNAKPVIANPNYSTTKPD